MTNFFNNNKKLFSNTIIEIIRQYEKQVPSDIYYEELSFDIFTGLKIINDATNIFSNEPAVLQIKTKSNELDFAIVGDIHGSLDSLIRIFKEKGYPPKTRYLFLGDYVDRGSQSCEVIILLYALKCLYPNDIYLIRGNHEFKSMTDYYGFKNECFSRVRARFIGNTSYSATTFYNYVTESFKALPICAIIDDSIFCVHGGISSHIKNRPELMQLTKVGNLYSENQLPQAEMMWNDPDKFVSMYSVGRRGIGSIFGERAVDDFLKSMNFKLIIRGHQNVTNGYDWPFGENGGLLTVFSAIDYCKTANNGGVAMILKEDDIENKQLVNIHQFDSYPKYDKAHHCFAYPLDINEKCDAQHDLLRAH